MYKKILSIAQQSLFPPRCPQCQALTAPNDPLCEDCIKQLTLLINHCDRCGIAPIEGETCGQCAIDPPPYQRFIGSYLYENLLKKIILDYKFNQQLHWARTLTRLFIPTIHHYYQGVALPMAIIPLPSHAKKTRQRGFNPILEISKLLSKETNISLMHRHISRIKLGAPQSQLPLNQRHKNIRGAFSAQIKPPPHIAIFDDVMTSGATISELAKTLRRNGVKKIDIWILARTLRIG